MKLNFSTLFNGRTIKAAALSTALLISTGALAAENLIPRIPADKLSKISLVFPGVDYQQIIVKFKENTGIRKSGSSLMSKITNPDMPFSFGLDWSAFNSELSSIQKVAANTGVEMSSLFNISDAKLAELKENGEKRTGEQLADLGLYFNFPIPAYFNETQIQNLIDTLNSFATIEIAYAEQKVVPTSVTPDFQDYNPEHDHYQGYLDAPTPADDEAFDGINAKYAWNFSGGRGEGVNVIAVEGGWRKTHEDFPTVTQEFSTDYYGPTWINHGTSMVGIYGAKDNGFGVTGIASQANIGLSNIIVWNDAEEREDFIAATAIQQAAIMAGEGGIITMSFALPQQSKANQGLCDCQDSICGQTPAERSKATFDAVKNATANGVIVIASAGNGGQNMDNEEYGDTFNRDVNDSGAIIVGASVSKNSQPMCYTSYGSRVDVRGWGENVTTISYGGMYKDPDDLDNKDKYYTGTSTGTSSATAMVTGAAAVLQGIAQNTYNVTLTPAEMRDIISTTGTEQTLGLDKNIGAQPDLEKAIAKLDDMFGVFECSEITDTNANHEAAGRAYSETTTEGQTCWGTFCYGGTEITTWYATGSDENLGTNGSASVTIHEETAGVWKTGVCPGPDVTAPVITLAGDNPMTIYQGSDFTDPGATAEDNIDGDITADIVVTGHIDTNSIDTYELVYTVSDAAGNEATETRTVNVVAVPACQEFTDTAANHESAGRAYSETTTEGQTCWGTFCYGGTTTTTWYAQGSDEDLGTNGNATVTLKTSENGYITGNCPTDPVAPVLESYQIAINTSVQAVITGTASDADGDIDRVVLGLGAASGIICEGTTSFTCTLDWDAYGFEIGAEISLSLSAWDSRNEGSNVVTFPLTRPEQQQGSSPVISNLDYTVDGQSMIVTADVTDVDGDLYAIRLMYADQPGELHCDNTGGNQYTCNLTYHDEGTYNFKVHAIDSEGNTAETTPFTVEFVEKVETTCVTDTNYNHVAAGRAYVGGLSNLYALAVGSDDDLGLYGSTYYSTTTSLEETSAGVWTKVTSCN